MPSTSAAEPGSYAGDGSAFTAASAEARGVSLALAAQVGGASYAVASRDATVFLGIGPRVVVFDLTEPARPVQVGQSPPLPRVVHDILLAGDLAYVAVGSAGLIVLDVADVTAPAAVATLETYGDAVALARLADRLLVASAENGLLILDVGEPRRPVPLGRWPAPTRVVDVAADGGRAYALDAESGLHILDLADPSAPRLLGASDRGDRASRIAMRGDYAYVTTLRRAKSGEARPFWGHELAVFAVADPPHARLVWAYPFKATFGDPDVLVSGDLAYLGGDAIAMFDVSDPSQPVPVGQTPHSPDAHHGCAPCVGALATVPGAVIGARGDVGGMVVFDPDPPGRPDILAVQQVPGYQVGSVDLAVDAAGPTLAAGDFLIEASDPFSPTYLTDTPWSGGTAGASAHQVAFAPGIAAVSALSVAGPNWLEVWSWPSVGTEGGRIGVVATGDDCHGASDIAVGRHLYAVGGSGIPECLPFLAVDITDPFSPTVVGRLAGTKSTGDFGLDRIAVAADGTTVYAVGFGPALNEATTAFDARLTVIDAADPARPRLVGRLGLPASPAAAPSPSGRRLDVAIPLGPPAASPDVALAERFAIVAFDPGTLAVVDVDDPTQPAIVATVRLHAQSAAEVEVSWPIALVAGGNAVSLVDLTLPSRPIVIDRLDLPGEVQAMALVGDRAWIVASEAGLLAVEWRRME